MREVIADIQDAVGDTMGITLRVSLDETIGDLGFSNAEVRDFVEMNARPAGSVGPRARHLGGLLGAIAVQGRGGAAGAGRGHS